MRGGGGGGFVALSDGEWGDRGDKDLKDVLPLKEAISGKRERQRTR